MRTASLWIALLLLSVVVAGCGGKHPLDGGWIQHTADGKGHVLTFDAKSNRLMVHGPNRADGTHADLAGTYALDGTNLTVEWKDGANTIKLTGKVESDHLHLSGPGFENAEFHHGADPHDHDHDH